MQVSGVDGYFALKQVELQAQINTKLVKSANDVVKQQAQQVLELISNANVGRYINVRA